MNLHSAIMATTLATLAFVAPAFAQTAVAAPDLPGVLGQLWGEILTAIAAIVAVAIPIISAYVVGLIREKWALSRLVLTQKRVDGLNTGIINIIRGELEKLRQDAAGSAKAEATATALPPTLEQRRQAVEAAQPKVAEAFKKTLQDLGKNDEQVKDLILARVEPAITGPPVVPIFPAQKG